MVRRVNLIRRLLVKKYAEVMELDDPLDHADLIEILNDAQRGADPVIDMLNDVIDHLPESLATAVRDVDHVRDGDNIVLTCCECQSSIFVHTSEYIPDTRMVCDRCESAERKTPDSFRQAVFASYKG